MDEGVDQYLGMSRQTGVRDGSSCSQRPRWLNLKTTSGMQSGFCFGSRRLRLKPTSATAPRANGDTCSSSACHTKQGDLTRSPPLIRLAVHNAISYWYELAFFLTLRQPSRLCLLLRMIAAPHERPTLNMSETHRHGFMLQESKLLRRIVPSHRQMIS